MNTLEITKKIMRQNGIIAKKSFGQNFLINDNVLESIVEAGDIAEQDVVIEIGPGLGNLTEYLLNTGAKVICFEIDEKMQEILENRLKNKENLQIIMQDILKVDLKEYLPEDKKVKIIANLPYYITTPIIFKLLEYFENIDRIVIMIQKEVAERLIAKEKSKDYGVLTINVGYKTDVEKVIDVPNSSFIPEPNVISSVVKITPNKEKMEVLGIQDENTFHKVIKLGFATRRKKLLNSLSLTNEIGISKEEIKEIMDELNINENARAEELNIKDIVNLANKIYNKQKK